MAKKLGRYESEAWRVRKNHSTFFADVIITSLYDAKNNFRGYAKITRDITKRKEAEDNLKESEERFLKIFNESPVATTLSELKTNKIAFANTLFYDTFGYTKEEVIGRTSEELSLIGPDEFNRVVSIIQILFIKNVPYLIWNH
jgi:PAS domain-containing protein